MVSDHVLVWDGEAKYIKMIYGWFLLKDLAIPMDIIDYIGYGYNGNTQVIWQKEVEVGQKCMRCAKILHDGYDNIEPMNVFDDCGDIVIWCDKCMETLNSPPAIK